MYYTIFEIYRLLLLLVSIIYLPIIYFNIVKNGINKNTFDVFHSHLSFSQEFKFYPHGLPLDKRFPNCVVYSVYRENFLRAPRSTVHKK